MQGDIKKENPQFMASMDKMSTDPAFSPMMTVIQHA
jgi:hypothetical protein